jgi:phage-related protein
MSTPVQLYQDGPRFFYKYQPINKYSLQNLVADQLWMSQVTSFNDPFEFKYDIINENKLTIQKQKNIKTFLECGVTCLATHPELTKNPDQDDRSFFPDNMLMWSHYSENLFGFCLGLRKKAVIFKVNYTNIFPSIDPDSKLELLAQFFIAMHTKQKCWEYENEYRALNLGIRNAGAPCKDSYELERIYFGLRTTAGDEALIRNILNDREITFYKAKLNKQNFRIEFDEA